MFKQDANISMYKKRLDSNQVLLANLPNLSLYRLSFSVWLVLRWSLDQARVVCRCCAPIDINDPLSFGTRLGSFIDTHDPLLNVVGGRTCFTCDFFGGDPIMLGVNFDLDSQRSNVFDRIRPDGWTTVNLNRCFFHLMTEKCSFYRTHWMKVTRYDVSFTFVVG